MKFLVIDDHELIREAMRAALAELDSEAVILEAPDSREGLRLIEENADLDLILLDLTLPDRDGFSLLSDLRQSHPAISIVVMSGRQDHDSVMKALNLGALGFIPKSVTRKVILGAIQLVMSGGVYIPPQALSGQEAASSAPGAASQPVGPRQESDRQPVSPADLGLTDRQMDVLTLIMQGKSNKAICRVLDLSEPTVKSHVSAILRALKVSNRTEIVVAVNALQFKRDRFETEIYFLTADLQSYSAATRSKDGLYTVIQKFLLDVRGELSNEGHCELVKLEGDSIKVFSRDGLEIIWLARKIMHQFEALKKRNPIPIDGFRAILGHGHCVKEIRPEGADFAGDCIIDTVRIDQPMKLYLKQNGLPANQIWCTEAFHDAIQGTHSNVEFVKLPPLLLDKGYPSSGDLFVVNIR
jgi:DNA-binding NarL/FixJ family response regulator